MRKKSNEVITQILQRTSNLHIQNFLMKQIFLYRFNNREHYYQLIMKNIIKSETHVCLSHLNMRSSCFQSSPPPHAAVIYLYNLLRNNRIALAKFSRDTLHLTLR